MLIDLRYTMHPILRFLSACTALVLITQCASSPDVGLLVNQRKAEIAAEAPGDYYIGRRFFIERTHFWGYLRRPQQDWQSSKLVIFNESKMRAPDRLPELPTGTEMAYGYDHNREYRIWGRFTGRKIYDPNSDLVLPEFELQRAEIKSASPGWLFTPKERFNGYQLLRVEPEANP